MVLAELVLFLDIGNSRVKASLMEGEVTLGSFLLPSKDPWTAAGLQALLEQSWGELGNLPQSACICSVVQGLSSLMIQALEQAGVKEILILDEALLDRKSVV